MAGAASRGRRRPRPRPAPVTPDSRHSPAAFCLLSHRPPPRRRVCAGILGPSAPPACGGQPSLLGQPGASPPGVPGRPAVFPDGAGERRWMPAPAPGARRRDHRAPALPLQWPGTPGSGRSGVTLGRLRPGQGHPAALQGPARSGAGEQSRCRRGERAGAIAASVMSCRSRRLRTEGERAGVQAPSHAAPSPAAGPAGSYRPDASCRSSAHAWTVLRWRPGTMSGSPQFCTRLDSPLAPARLLLALAGRGVGEGIRVVQKEIR